MDFEHLMRTLTRGMRMVRQIMKLFSVPHKVLHRSYTGRPCCSERLQCIRILIIPFLYLDAFFELERWQSSWWWCSVAFCSHWAVLVGPYVILPPGCASHCYILGSWPLDCSRLSKSTLATFRWCSSSGCPLWFCISIIRSISDSAIAYLVYNRSAEKYWSSVNSVPVFSIPLCQHCATHIGQSVCSVAWAKFKQDALVDKEYAFRGFICAAQFGDYCHLADAVEYIRSSPRVVTKVANPLLVMSSNIAA